MRVLTLTELMRLSRTELFALVAQMTTALSEYPEGEYVAAGVNPRFFGGIWERCRADRGASGEVPVAGSGSWGGCCD